MIMTWHKPSDIDWDEVFDEDMTVLVKGQERDFFGNVSSGYAVGTLHTLSDTGFTMESIQGEIGFEFEDIELVCFIEDPSDERDEASDPVDSV